MKQIERINISELKEIAGKTFGSMVKADVDVAKKIIVIDAELHAEIRAKITKIVSEVIHEH